jgi:hemerythrin-like domain-containing protein
LGSPIKEKGSQVQFLKQRLTMFSEVLDSINPEEVDLEDIDRLITIIDELEDKCKEFTNRDEE